MAAGVVALLPLSCVGPALAERMRAAPLQAWLLHALLARAPLLQHQSNLGKMEIGVRMCPLLRSQLGTDTAGRAQCCLCGFPLWFWGYLRAAKPWGLG